MNTLDKVFGKAIVSIRGRSDACAMIGFALDQAEPGLSIKPLKKKEPGE